MLAHLKTLHSLASLQFEGMLYRPDDLGSLPMRSDFLSWTSFTSHCSGAVVDGVFIRVKQLTKVPKRGHDHKNLKVSIQWFSDLSNQMISLQRCVMCYYITCSMVFLITVFIVYQRHVNVNVNVNVGQNRILPPLGMDIAARLIQPLAHKSTK